MKQGGLPPTGKWVGGALGGVQAPEPIRLPDPKVRFLATADRLDVLAQGHPLAAWLKFMAALSRAQHVAAISSAPAAPVDSAQIEEAIASRKPPLAAETHVRDPRWREALTILLKSLDQSTMPSNSESAVDALRLSNPDAVEALAHDFLCGTIDERNTISTLYVTAALQVYFTLAAAPMPAPLLRLLPDRGACPCCGSPPVCGFVTASGQTPGTRYLYCSLCSTAWNHVRAVCITCENSGALSLRGIEGDSGAVKAEVCDDCHTYAKMLYQAKDMQMDPFADDLATLGLDMMVAEAGWARHAPNPLLLARSL